MNELKKWISRLIRSKQINAAHLVVVLGAVQSQSEFFSRWLTPADLGTLISGIGIVMYILRGVTTQPLKDK